MSLKKPLQFTTDVILYPLLFVFIMWLVFWVEMRFNLRLSKWGIYPQKLEGLRGVIFAPFIHGSLKHIFNNSIPLLVLSTTLFYFYHEIRWKVLLLGLLLTGILTWSFARPALHIGASGVVYMLAAFLFFKGILSKQFQLTAISFVVVFLYGSLLWYLFPIDPKISWEGHLSGFVVGIAFALIFKKNPVENKKYDWERPDFNPENDAFLRHFDEEGNFIENLSEDDVSEISETNTEPPHIKVNYIFKKREEQSSDNL